MFERLKQGYTVDLELMPPRIRYHETIRIGAEARYRHKKQSGGAGQFAEVGLRIEPVARDEGFPFTPSLVDQDVDRVFVPAVEQSVQTAAIERIHGGYRVTEVKINLFGGMIHPVDSKDIAFQIAGYLAFKEAFRPARPVLLEPIHELEIRVPEGFVGRVVGNISGRRGKILGRDVSGRLEVLRAQVPAAQRHHYPTVLRSLPGGRGLHAAKFSHSVDMPAELEKTIVAEYVAARAAGTARNHAHQSGAGAGGRADAGR